MANNLTKAFAQLRKEGFFEKQNFWCCQSCAWYAVPKDKENVVFYHQQDKDNLKRTGSVYLAWKGNGNRIKEVMEQHGMKVDWDGSKDSRIRIDTN